MREAHVETGAILEESYIAYLCTVNAQNQSHVTPVFFIADPNTGCLYFLTPLNSRKTANLSMNPKVALTLDIRDPVNPLGNQGIMVQGVAEVEAHLASLQAFGAQGWDRLLTLFRERYPGFDRWLEEISEEKGATPLALVRVKMEKVTHWRGPWFKATSV